MKRIVSTLCLLATLAVTAPAFGATVTLAWDPNPATEEVTGYSVYRDGSKVWSGAATTMTDNNVVPGAHTYTATASNVWGESPHSNKVTTAPTASAPFIRVTVTVETMGGG